jgi:hypothetical protein
MKDFNISAALAATDADDTTLRGIFRENFLERVRVVDDIIVDLVRFGASQGYTANQLRNAIGDLFSLSLEQWCGYVLFAAQDIITTVENDATLPWLDLDASGQTIRQRLINRLS